MNEDVVVSSFLLIPKLAGVLLDWATRHVTLRLLSTPMKRDLAGVGIVRLDRHGKCKDYTRVRGQKDFGPIGPNLSGLCMCGCGRKTKIVTKAIGDTVMGTVSSRHSSAAVQSPVSL